jgi:hypothetical protein
LRDCGLEGAGGGASGEAGTGGGRGALSTRNWVNGIASVSNKSVHGPKLFVNALKRRDRAIRNPLSGVTSVCPAPVEPGAGGVGANEEVKGVGNNEEGGRGEGRGGVTRFGFGGLEWSGVFTVLSMHRRRTHRCFSLFGPPNRGRSRQYVHCPQSTVEHASQTPHAVRRSPGIVGLVWTGRAVDTPPGERRMNC